MGRAGETTRPLMRAVAVSVLAHLLVLALPVSGERLGVANRVFVPQPPLPVLEARWSPPVHAALSMPPVLGVPVTEPPPPQVIDEAALPAPTLADGADSDPVVPLRYYRPSEVSAAPYPLTLSPIDIDDAAVGPEGMTFAIEVLIDEFGRVDGLKLLSGSVPAAVWAKVENEFGRTTYRPARILDQAVKSRLRIELFVPPAARP